LPPEPYPLSLHDALPISTGVDVAAETSAPLAELAKWKASQLATASFGQGVDATPIEMLAAVNVVAAGGNLVWPHVVDDMIDSKRSEEHTSELQSRSELVC